MSFVVFLSIISKKLTKYLSFLSNRAMESLKKKKRRRKSLITRAIIHGNERGGADERASNPVLSPGKSQTLLMRPLTSPKRLKNTTTKTMS